MTFLKATNSSEISFILKLYLYIQLILNKIARQHLGCSASSILTPGNLEIVQE